MARSAKTGSGKPATSDKDGEATAAVSEPAIGDGADQPPKAEPGPADKPDTDSPASDTPAPATDAPDPGAVEDAEIVAETPPAETPWTRQAEQSAAVGTDSATMVSPETHGPETEVPETQRPETEGPETDSLETDRPAPDMRDPEPPPPPRPEPVPPPAPQVTAPQVTVQKVGFVPIVLGGAIAAALGFGAAWYLQGQQQDPTLPATVSALGDRMATLEGQVANLPAAPDLGPLTADIAATRAEIDTAVAAATGPIGETLAALDARLTELERAPAADGTLADAAIASWEAEIDTLRAEIAAQETRMQGIADEAAERLSLAQSTVAEIEQSATENANQALQRAALTRILAALDTGSAFDDVLGELAGLGVAVPDALTGLAVDGVPTLARLQQSYPDAARAALAAARAEGLADDGDNPVMSLLRSTLDVRSVAPREGDDPDAILSRAEAALRDGRLADSLAEVDTLPEVVRAEMTVWTQAATTRLSALAAAEALSQSLNAN